MTRPLFKNITIAEAEKAKDIFKNPVQYQLASCCTALMRGYSLPFNIGLQSEQFIFLEHANPRFNLVDGAGSVSEAEEINRMSYEQYGIFSQFAKMLNAVFREPKLSIARIEYPTSIIVNPEMVTIDNIAAAAGRIKGYISDNAAMQMQLKEFRDGLLPVLSNKPYQTLLFVSGTGFARNSLEYAAFENYATFGAEIQHTHSVGMLALFPHSPLDNRNEIDKKADEWLKKLELAGGFALHMENPVRDCISNRAYENHPSYALPAVRKMFADLDSPQKIDEGFEAWHRACKLIELGAKDLRSTRENCLSRSK